MGCQNPFGEKKIFKILIKSNLEKFKASGLGFEIARTDYLFLF